MSKVDWSLIQRTKDLYRERVRSRTFAAKLQTLDRLRERESQMRRFRKIEGAASGARSAVKLAERPYSNGPSASTGRLVLLGADSTFVALISKAQTTGTVVSTTLVEPSKPVSA